MGSSTDENRKHPWDAVIRELVAKGEVSEDVLHDSDTIIRWWRSLDPTKQEEIKSRVEGLSQGIFAEVPQKKPKTSSKNLLIGCGVALALIIILAVSMGTCLGGESTETTLSTNEQNYATTIASQTEELSTAFTNLGDLLQSYQFGNEEWTINVAAQLVIIRMIYDEAMAMEPPSSMAEIHYKYVQGLKHYYTMTDLLTKGIDQLDANLIEQGTIEMYKGTDYIEEATRLTNEFVANRQ